MSESHCKCEHEYTCDWCEGITVGNIRATAEIVAKLRERAYAIIRDCGGVTHIASMANLVDKANDDLKTADWIEAGCPS